MKLEFEGTTDEIAEVLAILKCFATVENIIDNDILETIPSVHDDYARNLILFFTALSRGSVHVESCQTSKNETSIRVFNANKFWNFKINERSFNNHTPVEVARQCINLGKW